MVNWIKSIAIVLVVGVFVSCNPRTEVSELVSTKVFNYPILKGKVENPLIRIQIENDSIEKTFQSIKLNFEETNTDFIKSVRLFYTESDSLFSSKIQIGEAVEANKITKIDGVQTLKKGQNFFWISCELSVDVDLTSSISVSLDYIQLENRKLAPVKVEGVAKLRLGVAVRKHNDDNVHTYRIPGLATTNDGTLLAIYDVRRESGRDLQGHMDIGVSRSTDGGNSWEPMRIALDMKEWGGLPQKFNGVSDANILVDRKTGAIFIAGLWMHGVINPDGIWEEGLTEVSLEWNHQWRNKGSQPGLGVKQTGQFLITKSTDDGKTWGEPINLTEMCKDPKWWLWAPAPGHGITLKVGTLVFPTQGRDETGLPFSNITYSKDGGKTWKTSNAAYQNTTESMAVELANGGIMLNMRNNRNREEKGDKNGRAISVTSDLGESWIEHETSCSALIECVCMASIHRHNYSDKNGSNKRVLFFSNPNSKYKRHKQTIKVSFDEGFTWPEKYWIELDEGQGAGYSCLTSIDENTIGILYDGSQAHMTFQAIAITDFVNQN
ncbi:MAG: exo-alpha-sialidase [Bacteroidetes bacterium]|nr:exo-alpha-sialidase [Bacteroidota bacterium]